MLAGRGTHAIGSVGALELVFCFVERQPDDVRNGPEQERSTISVTDVALAPTPGTCLHTHQRGALTTPNKPPPLVS